MNKKTNKFSSIKYDLASNFLTLFYVLATFVIAVCIYFEGINIIKVITWDWFWLFIVCWSFLFAVPCQLLAHFTLNIIYKSK